MDDLCKVVASCGHETTLEEMVSVKYASETRDCKPCTVYSCWCPACWSENQDWTGLERIAVSATEGDK